MSVKSSINRNILYPLWNFKNNDHRNMYLREYEKLQYSKKNDLEQRQISLLKRLLVHAKQNIPFYKMHYEKLGFNTSKKKNNTKGNGIRYWLYAPGIKASEWEYFYDSLDIKLLNEYENMMKRYEKLINDS